MDSKILGKFFAITLFDFITLMKQKYDLHYIFKNVKLVLQQLTKF